MADLGIDADTLYRLVPVKSDLVHNLIIRDFMEVRHLCNGRLDVFEYNRTKYYTENLRDVAVRREAGASWIEHRDAVLQALAGESLPTRLRVFLSREYGVIAQTDGSRRSAVRRLLRLPARVRSIIENGLRGRPLEGERFRVESGSAWDALAADESRRRTFGTPGHVGGGQVLRLEALERNWPWKETERVRRPVFP